MALAANRQQLQPDDVDPNVNPHLYGGPKGYMAHQAHSPVPQVEMQFYGPAGEAAALVKPCKDSTKGSNLATDRGEDTQNWKVFLVIACIVILILVGFYILSTITGRSATNNEKLMLDPNEIERLRTTTVLSTIPNISADPLSEVNSSQNANLTK